MEENKKKNPLCEEQLKEVAAAGERKVMAIPDKFDKTIATHIPHHVEFTPPTGDIEF